MKIGTKSLLFGAHQFAIHPIFVFLGWWKLYGFPRDPRLWVVFLVHDWGYWGKPNMDGEEGEEHIWAGAKICGWLFDFRKASTRSWFNNTVGRALAGIFGDGIPDTSESIPVDFPLSPWTWYCLSFYHSRFIAKQYGVAPSPLCAADKLATCITPRWLYMPLVKATGEVWEYVEHFVEAESNRGKYAKEVKQAADQALQVKLLVRETREEVLERWYLRMTRHMKRWSYTHAPKLNNRKIPRVSEDVFSGKERCDICLEMPEQGELVFTVKRRYFHCVESACERCAWKCRELNELAA